MIFSYFVLFWEAENRSGWVGDPLRRPLIEDAEINALHLKVKAPFQLVADLPVDS